MITCSVTVVMTRLLAVRRVNNLSGGDGNDHLAGTNMVGNKDVLTGGTGQDIFRISGGYGEIRGENAIEIKDFTSEDTIEFGFFGEADPDNFYTVHYGSSSEGADITFIRDGQNGELVAAINGTEPYYLPPVGFR